MWHREGGLTRGLEAIIPNRVFVADTLAPVSNGRVGPEYDALDAALAALEKTIRSAERPVLVPVKHSTAARLIANPFYLGQALLPDATTLGDLHDAVVYFGRGPEAGALVRPPAADSSPLPARRLMAVNYEGSRQLGVREIEARLRRHEVPVLLDVPFHDRTICVVREVLLDMLLEKGFADADVKPEIVPVDRTNQRLLRVTFRITDGTRSPALRSAARRPPPTARCSGG